MNTVKNDENICGSTLDSQENKYKYGNEDC